MGLKSKPSETNKFVVKYDPKELERPQGYRKFNTPSDSKRIVAYSEEELFLLLDSKLASGWYQVSDIFKEESIPLGGIRYDSGRKKINPRRPRHLKKMKPDTYFVYMTRIKPSILRKYKKAYTS